LISCGARLAFCRVIVRYTADSKIVKQRDLLGVRKAIGDFGGLSLKLEKAFKKNDASAIAALFTEDGILVASDGIFSGRQAIEKRYAEIFSGGLSLPLAVSVTS
jgi:hypothetical protein